ncbi:Fumarate lyase [Penicillium psychrosexuale]|uniref:Fumarate lyase n=1 Tax=Penicillium psychrosexuale TaxID=1002107 RepID=UPI002544F9D1|nr:Fumarate lyase [Penicillium psychrosexuale]KAJ5796802.1 Fumarate lyase [Penicillium psychrosexuale]
MAVSALDSRIFRNLFGTQEIRDIFTDEAYVKSLIEVEAALARAEATVGVIPAHAGKGITEALARLQIEHVAITCIPATTE